MCSLLPTLSERFNDFQMYLVGEADGATTPSQMVARPVRI